MDSLTKNIAEFVEVLREAGVRASISETIDAVKVLKHIDVLDRNGVKIAMSACLAKSERERLIFSQAFDKFFILPEQKQAHINEKIEQIKIRRKEIIEEASELKFQGQDIDMEDELKEVYFNLPQNEKQSIRDYVDKISEGKNVHSKFKPLVDKIVRGKLNSMMQKHQMGQCRYESIFDDIASSAGIMAGEIMSELCGEDDLLYKNLEDIKEDDIPKVIMLIKMIAERLRRNIAKKYKMSNKKTRIDLRKTIRSNLSTGGVMFKLKYKSRPRRKNKFLILCDISASMYRFSGFVLQFILGMYTNLSSVEAYIFSEYIEHIKIEKNMTYSDFEHHIKQSHIWRKGTNINTALAHVLDSSIYPLTSSTIVLIVSDAKTLDTGKTFDSLKVLEGRVKRILWLNPIPEKEWAKIHSIEGFKKHSTMLDCSNLEMLAKACSSL